MCAFGGKSVIETSLIFELPVPSEKLLAEMFGLSPAEARLAQRIARGDSLEDIAADAGIKMPTARCQLASVFGKTGTNRQPKLVALLCHLAYRSAPPVRETISPARTDRNLAAGTIAPVHWLPPRSRTVRG